MKITEFTMYARIWAASSTLSCSVMAITICGPSLRSSQGTLIDALFDTEPIAFSTKSLLWAGNLPISNIIATHTHRSHIGGMAELKSQTNAKVYAHEWDGIIEGKRKATKVSVLPKPPLAAYYTQFGLAVGVDGHKTLPG